MPASLKRPALIPLTILAIRALATLSPKLVLGLRHQGGRSAQVHHLLGDSHSEPIAPALRYCAGLPL
jgi:hypothetical protein